MIVWTHRGFPGIENTKRAFADAYAQGVRYFETDIHATLDGVLVLAHDQNTSRLIGISLEIPEVIFSELVRLTKGHFNWYKLEDLLRDFPDVQISIDIKHEAALKPLIEMLAKRDLKNLVIGSFSHKRITNFRGALPRYRTALTPLEILRLKFGFHKGLGGAAELFAMVPIKHLGLKIISKKFIRRCNNLGIPVHVWTVNSVAQANQLVKLGAAGVVTDDFRLFR